MGFRKCLKWVKGKWAFLLSLIILAVIGFVDVKYPTINPFLFIALLVISGIFSVVQGYKDDNKDEVNDNKVTKGFEDIKTSDKKFGESLEKQEEHLQKIDENLDKKKKDNLAFLYELIENGVISESDAQKHMPSRDVYTLYCFPTSLDNLEKEGVKPFRAPTRQYPLFLEKLGFIRMGGRALYYITTEDKLDENLRDISVLRNIIKKGLDDCFKKEWISYLEELSKRKTFKKEYNEIKNLRYSDRLKASIIITRSKLNSRNLDFIHERTFSKEFYDLINSKIDLKEIKLPEEKKIEVKKFLLDSSIQLIFSGERQINIDKLQRVESDMRSNLKIKSLLDYLSKNDADLLVFFNKEFRRDTSLKHIKKLKERITYYQEALKDLRINI